MKHTISKVVGSSAAVAVLALGGAAAPAVAKPKHHHKKTHAKRHTTNSSGSTSSSSSTTTPETALTGDTLTSVSNAALAAVPGGTVDRATTENDSSNSSAAYEVHVTKSDGSHVVVIEDASFNVLSVNAGRGPGGGGCHGGDSGSSSSSTGTTT